MKVYYISVPRTHRFYFSVEAEDRREAYFEAVKTMVFKVMNDMVPLDISEGHEVYPCEDCTSFFQKSDLKQMDGKLVCGQCAEIGTNGIPTYW